MKKIVKYNNSYLAWSGVLIVLCLLMLPNILLSLYDIDDLVNAREILGLSILMWLLLLVVTARVSYFLIITLPFLWLMPLEAIHIFLYKRPSDIHIFGIIADTTFDEAFQFTKPYWVYMLGYLFGITGLVFFFVKCTFATQIYVPKLLTKTIAISAGLLVVSFSIGNYLTWQQEQKIIISGGADKLLFDTSDGLFASMLGDLFPFGVALRFFNYKQQVRQIESLQKELESFSFSASQLLTTEPEVYVLIIGETTRAKNLQLNGYKRNTNPLLSERKNLISFSNMVSGWLWTRMSVPVILTRKKTANRDIFFPEKSIVSLFSEAGFDTFWLSTQSPYGFHDSPIALSASESDYIKFLNPADYKSAGLYDDVMLPYLEKIVASYSNKFIVLHTLGSHFNYADRYPDKFDIFKPSLKDKDASLQDETRARELLNSYDNSIVFSDYVIDQVIDIVNKHNNISAVFYISDHGEVIFDNGCDKSGHGHHTQYDHVTASMLWVSDAYRMKYGNRFDLAKERANSPLSTEYVFHSLAGLAGLEYPDKDETQNIFSKEWQAYPRYLQSGVYFDSSDREGKCDRIVQKK